MGIRPVPTTLVGDFFWKSVKVPPKLFLRILEVAIEQELSVVELLEKMFQEVPDSNPTSESKITANSDEKVQNEAVNPEGKDQIK